MKIFLRFLACVLFFFLVTGCGSLYQGIVTFRDVRDTALKDWAAASHSGLTSAAIDKAVMDADARVQKVAKVLEDALTAYKTNGDKASYLSALNAMRAAVGDLVNLILPVITPSQSTTLKSMQSKAVAQ